MMLTGDQVYFFAISAHNSDDDAIGNADDGVAGILDLAGVDADFLSAIRLHHANTTILNSDDGGSDGAMHNNGFFAEKIVFAEQLAVTFNQNLASHVAQQMSRAKAGSRNNKNQTHQNFVTEG